MEETLKVLVLLCIGFLAGYIISDKMIEASIASGEFHGTKNYLCVPSSREARISDEIR